MLRDKELHEMVSDLRDYIVDHYQLNKLSDEQLEDVIEDLVRERASSEGLRVSQRVEVLLYGGEYIGMPYRHGVCVMALGA